MSLEEKEEKLSESSTDAGDILSTTPIETDDDASRETSLAEDSEKNAEPTANTREDLIKSLTGQNKKEDEESEEEEEPKEEDSKEEPESKDKEEVIDDKEEVVNDDSKKSKAAKRFEVLTDHNKQLKTELDKATPMANYGQKIFEFCRDSEISTEDFGVWLAIAATARKDPATAAANLEKLGIKARTEIQTVKEVPQELEDKILDLAADGSLTPDGVKALLGITRTARAKAPQVPEAKKPDTTVTQETNGKPLNAPPSAEKVAYDRRLAVAIVDIDKKDAEYAAKYPADWSALKGTITAAMKRYHGTDPSQWVGFFDDEVAKAIAKVKRVAKPESSLRPSTTAPKTNSNKAVPNSRAAIIGELTGKTR